MIANSFHPRAHTGAEYGDQAFALPPRPLEIGPIFDPLSTTEPLADYSAEFCEQNYGQGDGFDREICSPCPKSNGSQDPYLYPTLTRNERLRLTMLWYYTRDLAEDTAVLQKMRTKLEVVKSVIGWEFAIVGILENDIYRRLATAGLPLAHLPRRESTCSHTVQQPPGSVFFIPDMSVDSRFQKSPHVAMGGLKMYAGTSLRCQTDDGEEFALGSLCVASNTVGPRLAQTQMNALVTFAEMLTQDIVSASRRKRAKQQEQNDILLRAATANSSSDQAEEFVMGLLKQVFPNAEVRLATIGAHGVSIHVGGPLVIPPTNESAIWEDDDFINESIRLNNHESLKASQPVRAIIAKLPEQPLANALVVSTNDITFIFDDVDIRYVTSCATLLTSIRQEKALKMALRARDQFMRDITHQLRTPIHGILGSLDLLIADLTAQSERNLATLSLVEGLSQSSNYHEPLAIIRSSTRELMTTVNNAIKYNQLMDTTRITKRESRSSPDELCKLESDLLADIVGFIPDGHLDRILIIFSNNLPAEIELTMIDMASLVECLQSLVLNALQNTSFGSVAITTTSSPDYTSVYYDVTDTGCGIAAADQERIFRPYEKVNVHTTGVGLGLPLACKMAEAMDGRVTLISSELGRGSHFRVEFWNPLLSCSIIRPQRLDERLDIVLSTFRVIAPDSCPATAAHIKTFLTSRGLQESDDISESLVVLTFANFNDEFDGMLKEASKYVLGIALVPAEMNQPELKVSHPHILFFSGQFTSRRLEQILIEANDEFTFRKAQAAQRVANTPGAQDEIDMPLRNRSVHSEGNLRFRKPMSCLLVDDNAINLRIVSMYCEKRKFPYTTAEDGLQAIVAYKTAANNKVPVDLILLDLQMPNCDGIQACQEIRAFERKEGLRPAIVFIITGQDSADDKGRCFAAGIDKYFVKPLPMKKLDEGVAEFFKST